MKMHLVIDCGNTLMKAGLFDENRNLKGPVIIDKEETLDSYIRSNNITSAIIASVIKEKTFVSKILKENSIPFLNIDSQTNLPFKNHYKTPETLGADRIASVSGGIYFLGNGPFLTINAGSCITYNLVDDNNAFVGGAISPGVNMRFKSMHDYTSALPLEQPVETAPEYGKNTSESLIVGTITGIRNEIQGFIEHWTKKFPGLRCVLGGGDASLIQKGMNIQLQPEPNLNLYGALKILEHNET